MALGGMSKEITVGKRFKQIQETLEAIEQDLSAVPMEEMSFEKTCAFMERILPPRIDLIIYNEVLQEKNPVSHPEVNNALQRGKTLFIPAATAISDHRALILTLFLKEEALAKKIRDLCDMHKQPGEPICNQFLAEIRKAKASQSQPPKVPSDDKGVSFMKTSGFLL